MLGHHGSARPSARCAQWQCQLERFPSPAKCNTLSPLGVGAPGSITISSLLLRITVLCRVNRRGLGRSPTARKSVVNEVFASTFRSTFRSRAPLLRSALSPFCWNPQSQRWCLQQSRAPKMGTVQCYKMGQGCQKLRSTICNSHTPV